MTSTLETLLFPLTPAEFRNQYFSCLPYAGQSTAREFCDSLNWDCVKRLLDSGHRDVLIARAGALVHQGPISYAHARSLYEEGCTIVIRHSEASDEPLAALSEVFRAEFSGDIDIQLYCTPAGQQGFRWHYDAEDVFVLQAAGSKEFTLRKNSINPLPFIDRMPQNMHYEWESSPVLYRCPLEPGDWLYIPAGYWHQAEARAASMHMSVGILPLCALDALDLLKERLRRSLAWHQRLPVSERTSPEEWARQWGSLFEKLGREIVEEIHDLSFLKELLKKSREAGRH